MSSNDNWCMDLEGLCMPNKALSQSETEDDQDNRQSKRNGEKADREQETYVDGDDSDDGNAKAMVFMISGCEDSQTSADVSNVSQFDLPDPNGRAGGACTSALLKVLYSNSRAVTNLTFVQVLDKMRRVLSRGGYSQIPQLTSSRPLDVNQTFYIVPPDCQGTKRAVVIGINYTEHANGQLTGCHNDCLNMKDYIMNAWGFEEENIIVLMDDGEHTSPTRANIMQAYKNVVAASKSGDAVFCHYSGHGGRLRDDDRNEEDDGYDETLIPLDYNSAGQIRDDDLESTLVSPLAQGVTLVSLMDCCHSGTVLDLPYKYGASTTTSNQFGSMKPSKRSTIICIVVALIVLVVVIVFPVLYA